MLRILIAAALLSVPLGALGQNTADTVQVGEENEQVTVQAGSNVALTIQVGSYNDASIAQTGENNVATITQIGENHSRDVTQDGNNLGYGSVQTESGNYTGSFFGMGGNAFTSTTLHFEAVQ